MPLGPYGTGWIVVPLVENPEPKSGEMPYRSEYRETIIKTIDEEGNVLREHPSREPIEHEFETLKPALDYIILNLLPKQQRFSLIRGIDGRSGSMSSRQPVLTATDGLEMFSHIYYAGRRSAHGN